MINCRTLRSILNEGLIATGPTVGVHSGALRPSGERCMWAAGMHVNLGSMARLLGPLLLVLMLAACVLASRSGCKFSCMLIGMLPALALATSRDCGRLTCLTLLHALGPPVK